VETVATRSVPATARARSAAAQLCAVDVGGQRLAEQHGPRLRETAEGLVDVRLQVLGHSAPQVDVGAEHHAGEDQPARCGGPGG
jgi:hypothetical protein